MPRKCTAKPRKYNQNDIEKALDLIANGTSIRAAARIYGMSDHLLREKLKKLDQGNSLIPNSGRKPALSKELEENIALCIGTLCKIGFSPTRNELIHLVSDY